MEEKLSYVYILTNYKHTVFYIGITTNLNKRMYEHVNKLVDGFTKKYRINQLMYYEVHTEILNAIKREKTIKRWKRDWKWNIIDTVNPTRINLYINGEVQSLPIDPATCAG